MKFYKKQLLDLVTEQLVESGKNYSKKQVNEVVHTFFSTLQDLLKTGDNVTIAKFGTFDTRQRKSRIMAHPLTKADLIVTDAIVPVFRASQSLKKLLK